MFRGRELPVTFQTTFGRSRGLWAVLAGAIATVAAVGLAAGLATQITYGSETAQGASVTEHPLAYWTWHETILGTIPAPVPARVSAAEATPTVLPRGARSYTIDAATAGDTAVAWTFDLQTTMPRSMELMLTFADGLSGPVSTLTVYVETPVRAPGAAVAFTFYWDAGTFAPGTLVIETMTGTAVACAAVGNCP